VRAIAKRRLPRIVFDFIDGGAEDEVTLRANRAAFEALTLRPRYLRPVETRDQSTTVFGRRLESPVILAPTGLPRLAHWEGERAAARAAVANGTHVTLATGGSTRLEDLMEETPGPHWFQLYLWPERARNEAMVKRAQAAGYRALVLTVDVPVLGRRERDLRHGFTVPFRPRLGMALEVARHPRWIAGYARAGPIGFANFDEPGTRQRPTAHHKLTHRNPAAGLDELRWLRELWEGPLLVKGLLTAEDAEDAIACGADGIIVSNHGGRQLDGVQTSIDALPQIVAAVGGRAEILLDSGVRRGTDVVKAIALGARAVLIGRPWLWGLAAGGEAGVARVLQLLRIEIDTALALVGCRSLGELDASYVVRTGAVENVRN
jgi:isopentenyl diphosphate isomerase/L-lactate dehydrogenase-like FMN-dependent dehydrogenase